MDKKSEMIYRYSKALEGKWEPLIENKGADKDPRYWLNLGLVLIHKRDGVIMSVYRVFK